MYKYLERRKPQTSKAASHIPVRPLPLQVVQRRPKRMVRDEEFREFIMLKDKEPITKYCMKNHYAISFRLAGKYTIEKLEKGAAAKGHHILDKSIKKESINDDELFKKIPEELLGLIGWWDKRKTGIHRLKGLYLSSAGMKRLGIKGTGKNKQAVSFKILLSKLGLGQYADKNEDDISEEERLEQLRLLAQMIQRKDNKDNGSITYADFITGDYDIHDLVYIAPGKKIRSAVSHPDYAVVRGLNAAMHGTYKSPSEYDRIQHGAQSSYSNYMSGHLHETPVLSLLQPDTPIAMCSPEGKWYRISSKDELKKFYENYGFNFETIWPTGTSLTEREEALKIPRRPHLRSRR